MEIIAGMMPLARYARKSNPRLTVCSVLPHPTPGTKRAETGGVGEEESPEAAFVVRSEFL